MICNHYSSQSSERIKDSVNLFSGLTVDFHESLRSSSLVHNAGRSIIQKLDNPSDSPLKDQIDAKKAFVLKDWSLNRIVTMMDDIQLKESRCRIYHIDFLHLVGFLHNHTFLVGT
jgi:hypothetical protein